MHVSPGIQQFSTSNLIRHEKITKPFYYFYCRFNSQAQLYGWQWILLYFKLAGIKTTYTQWKYAIIEKKSTIAKFMTYLWINYELSDIYLSAIKCFVIILIDFKYDDTNSKTGGIGAHSFSRQISLFNKQICAYFKINIFMGNTTTIALGVILYTLILHNKISWI